MNSGRKQLRSWIFRRGITQQEAADMLGIHFTTINKILNTNRVPEVPMLDKIEQVCGIPIREWARDTKVDDSELVVMSELKRRL